jgi:hypothetical protein
MGIYNNLVRDPWWIGYGIATKFLNSHGDAGRALLKAEKAALDAAKIDKRYDPIHKKMVRLRKEWNRIEQEREQ